MDVRNNLDPKDYKYLKDKPDVGFSPERNKAIIEGSIKKYEALLLKKVEEKIDHYAERADAVVSYLRSLDRGSASSNMLKYFGKRELARLRGQQIRDQLMSGLGIVKNGQVIKKGI